MKINDDVFVSIGNSLKLLDQIILRRQQSLQNKSVDIEFELLVKNFLENLRSALDYLAFQIAEENKCTGKKGSFPILSETSHGFHLFMKNNFPNLEKNNSDLFKKLESVQYYNNTNEREWMKNLKVLVNHYKHVRLKQQKVKNDGGVAVIGDGIRIFAKEINMEKGGQIIDARGNALRGSQKITKDTKTITDNGGLVVATLHWDDLFFEEINKPMLETITGIITGIQNMMKIF